MKINKKQRKLAIQIQTHANTTLINTDNVRLVQPFSFETHTQQTLATGKPKVNMKSQNAKFHLKKRFEPSYF